MVLKPIVGYLGMITLLPLTRILSLPLDKLIIPFLLLYLTPTLQVNYSPFEPSNIFTPKGI